MCPAEAPFVCTTLLLWEQSRKDDTHKKSLWSWIDLPSHDMLFQSRPGCYACIFPSRRKNRKPSKKKKNKPLSSCATQGPETCRDLPALRAACRPGVACCTAETSQLNVKSFPVGNNVGKVCFLPSAAPFIHKAALSPPGLWAVRLAEGEDACQGSSAVFFFSAAPFSKSTAEEKTAVM